MSATNTLHEAAYALEGSMIRPRFKLSWERVSITRVAPGRFVVEEMKARKIGA